MALTSLHERPYMLWKMLPTTNENSEDEGSDSDSDYCVEDDDSESEIESDEEEELDLRDDFEMADDEVNNDWIVTEGIEEEAEEDNEWTVKLWGDSSRRILWRKRLEKVNKHWKETFGCPVDTEANPQVHKQLLEVENAQKKSRYSRSAFVAFIVLLYLIQWVVIVRQLSSFEAPDNAKCPSMIRSIVADRQNVTLVRSVLQICDDRVQNAVSNQSKWEAYSTRGNVHVLGMDLKAALQDYQRARRFASDSSMQKKMELKIFRTYWVSLYRSKRLEHLVRSCLGARHIDADAHRWVEALTGVNVIQNIKVLLYNFKRATMSCT